MVVALVSTSAWAQKFDKVETPFVLGKWEEAKTVIDKIMSDPKVHSNPDAWLWNATVYGKIFEDSNLNKKYPNAGDIAYNSFKRYESLQPTYKLMNESAIPGKNIVNSLYMGNWNVGYSGYYEKKRYDSAFKYLARSAEFSDLIIKNKWADTRQALDTLVILFSAYAAENAKLPEESVKYLSKLADMNITTVPFVGEVKEIYYILLQHYTAKKDLASFNKYLQTAKRLFPALTEDWDYMETKYMEDNYSLAEKEAAYDKGDREGTLTAMQYLQYANAFYNLKDAEKESLDSAKIRSLKDKARIAFGKAYSKDNTLAVGSFNAGLLNYFDWQDLDEKWRDNIRKMGELNRSKANEKDPKKKVALEAKVKKEVDALKAKNAEIEKQQRSFVDEGIDWMEKTYTMLAKKTTLDKEELNLINKSVDYLATFFEWKREKAKGNNAEYDKWDALFKKYDALHGNAATPAQQKFAKVKIGMKRADVVALLGEPTEESVSTTREGKMEVLSYDVYRKNINLNAKGEVVSITDYK